MNKRRTAIIGFIYGAFVGIFTHLLLRTDIVIIFLLMIGPLFLITILDYFLMYPLSGGDEGSHAIFLIIYYLWAISISLIYIFLFRPMHQYLWFIMSFIPYSSITANYVLSPIFVCAIIGALTGLLVNWSVMQHNRRNLAKIDRSKYKNMRTFGNTRISHNDDTCPSGEYHNWEYIEISSNGNRYKHCTRCDARYHLIGSDWVKWG